ncbi:MAG: MBG domain-containing protein [Acetobacter papayae]|uniref:beta strand repeat-containing protein n=1 Tax=Acetobacter papayae TaxID=1076592 RepID=UPI0039E9A3B3
MTLTTRMLLLGVTALTPGFAWAQALPTGGTYAAGSGTISTTGATTTIDQSSARGVINWQGFSIGAGGSVQFNNGSGATLNRVTGDQLSSLQGHLGATGTVFLINPNGVVIGPGGTVVTGGSFVASTRDTPNSAFMKGGNVTLSGTSAGTVTNAGKITSTNGNVVLVGAAVSNSGEISAAGGTAALVAGNQVVLSEADGPAGIYVVADSKAKGNVTNTGRIKAAAATLASAGGNVYALAGNREGLVQATGTTTVNGQVWLSAPHGTVTVESTTLSATNADGSGGVIRANGAAVSLGGKAVLNASASKAGRKGGQILVGTDSMGGTNLARSTTVASGATLKATGKGKGAGGTIETSAHTLAMGAATISAGLGGSWLLDPDDLTIDSAAASTVNAALNSGTNVTEQTSATTGSGSGDILLNAALSWNSTASLILSAYHSITLNADITVSGAGTLTLTTNNNIGGTSTGDGTVNFGSSTIQFTSSSLTAANTASSSPLTIDGHGYTLITSPSDLQNAVGTSGYYALAKPLDMSSISNFTPLAQSGFSGTFNGLGNTISNLTINDSVDLRVGLFSFLVTSGTISHVGLIGGTVTDNFSDPYGSVGELVGFNGGGTISYAYATGNVSGSNPAAYIGGLVGLNYATITNSYATGNVSSSGVNISAPDYTYAGGLVGYNGGDGTITNAYATGNVANTNSGLLYAVGGLAGNNGNSATISNTYSTGKVSSTSGIHPIGGLVGTNSSSIENSYWDTTTSGQSYGGSDSVTGLTTTQLAAELPSRFDTTIWGNLNNQTTPYLLGVSANQQVLSGSNTVFGTNAGMPVTVILNAAGLSAINSNLAGNYGLAADLDASGLGNTSPIGENTPFTGTFYGAGHTIANLTIADATDQYVGLFGQLGAGAKIEDIGLIQEVISSTYTNGASVGGLVGYNSGGTLLTVYTTGTVSGPQSATSTTSVGGLVGQNGDVGASGNTITSSYSTAAVSGGDTTYIGGLVGWNSGTITSSFASGDVSSNNTGNTYNFIGGLAGWNASGTIKTSYATGNVSGGNLAGGLVGQNHYGHIEETYATGNVTGNSTTTNSGGLVGHDDVNDPSQLILDSYSTGSVNSRTGMVGGLIGGLNNEASSTYADSQYFSHDYFDTTTTGQSGNAGLNLGNGVTGLTTTQWLLGSTSRFSNSADWVAGSPYPLLAALPYVIITASGTQIYGQSTPTITITSILDQSGNNAASLTDTRSLTWLYPGVNSNSNVNSSAELIGHGATATGYQVTYAGTDTVTPAALTITALNQTITYGQTPVLNNTAFRTSGLVNGDTVSNVSLSTNATNQSGVGSYAITANNASGTGLSNYTITYTAGAYTITPAALTITALNQTGTYGQNPTLNTADVKVTGLLNGDTLSSATLTTNATSQSGVGSYTITASNASGTGLSNYTINYATGAYSITPAALTITALNQTGIYGQTPVLDNTAFKTSGLVNGNTVSSISLSSNTTSQSGVGAYAITANNASGTGLGNYTITYTTGTYSITPAALTITALNQTGTYGQTPVLDNTAFRTSGLVNGDTVSSVSLSTTADSHSGGGSYAITIGDVRGTGLSNYAITYQNGNYNITQITTIPVFWPMAMLNGHNPAASGPANPTTAGAGNSPDLTLVNTYKPLTLPDGTAAATQPNTYQIVLPATSYTNRLKDTF